MPYSSRLGRNLITPIISHRTPNDKPPAAALFANDPYDNRTVRWTFTRSSRSNLLAYLPFQCQRTFIADQVAFCSKQRTEKPTITRRGRDRIISDIAEQCHRIASS